MDSPSLISCSDGASLAPKRFIPDSPRLQEERKHPPRAAWQPPEEDNKTKAQEERSNSKSINSPMQPRPPSKDKTRNPAVKRFQRQSEARASGRQGSISRSEPNIQNKPASFLEQSASVPPSAITAALTQSPKKLESQLGDSQLPEFRTVEFTNQTGAQRPSKVADAPTETSLLSGTSIPTATGQNHPPSLAPVAHPDGSPAHPGSTLNGETTTVPVPVPEPTHAPFSEENVRSHTALSAREACDFEKPAQVTTRTQTGGAAPNPAQVTTRTQTACEKPGVKEEAQQQQEEQPLRPFCSILSIESIDTAEDFDREEKKVLAPCERPMPLKDASNFDTNIMIKVAREEESEIPINRVQKGEEKEKFDENKVPLVQESEIQDIGAEEEDEDEDATNDDSLSQASYFERVALEDEKMIELEKHIPSLRKTHTLIRKSLVERRDTQKTLLLLMDGLKEWVSGMVTEVCKRHDFIDGEYGFAFDQSRCTVLEKMLPGMASTAKILRSRAMYDETTNDSNVKISLKSWVKQLIDRSVALEAQRQNDDDDDDDDDNDDAKSSEWSAVMGEESEGGDEEMVHSDNEVDILTMNDDRRTALCQALPSMHKSLAVFRRQSSARRKSLLEARGLRPLLAEWIKPFLEKCVINQSMSDMYFGYAYDTQRRVLLEKSLPSIASMNEKIRRKTAALPGQSLPPCAEWVRHMLTTLVYKHAKINILHKSAERSTRASIRRRESLHLALELGLENVNHETVKFYENANPVSCEN